MDLLKMPRSQLCFSFGSDEHKISSMTISAKILQGVLSVAWRNYTYIYQSLYWQQGYPVKPVTW